MATVGQSYDASHFTELSQIKHDFIIFVVADNACKLLYQPRGTKSIVSYTTTVDDNVACYVVGENDKYRVVSLPDENTCVYVYLDQQFRVVLEKYRCVTFSSSETMYLSSGFGCKTIMISKNPKSADLMQDVVFVTGTNGKINDTFMTKLSETTIDEFVQNMTETYDIKLYDTQDQYSEETLTMFRDKLKSQVELPKEPCVELPKEPCVEPPKEPGVEPPVEVPPPVDEVVPTETTTVPKDVKPKHPFELIAKLIALRKCIDEVINEIAE